jgi:hypothetical protein
MDRTTRCPKCGKRMVPVVIISGRTDLQCISCDDPAVKWAESPLTAPDKPFEPAVGGAAAKLTRSLGLKRRRAAERTRP